MKEESSTLSLPSALKMSFLQQRKKSQTNHAARRLAARGPFHPLAFGSGSATGQRIGIPRARQPHAGE
jgi:hypothetical protein